MEHVLKSLAAVSAVTVGTLVSASAFAIDGAPIEAAMADGSTVVTTVVGGLIGLVAVMVGVGIVMSLMKRS